jgi:hypothetical protein
MDRIVRALLWLYLKFGGHLLFFWHFGYSDLKNIKNNATFNNATFNNALAEMN